MSTPPIYREALDGSEMVRVLKDGRTYLAPVASVAALAARPEEAAHFTATAKLPAVTVLQPITLTLTGLVPTVAGDRIRKGEAVLVAPVVALPQGVNIAAAFVPADDVVAVQLTTGISIAASAAATSWSVTVLR